MERQLYQKPQAMGKSQALLELPSTHFTTIISGPQGIGKTRNAARIAAAYGMNGVVDDWQPGDPIQKHKLHLTNARPEKLDRAKMELLAGFQLRVTNYEVAMQMVEISEDDGA